MTMSTQPEFKTARLILRPFTLADAPEVRRLAGDRAIADTTLNIPHPYEDGMAKAWIGTHKKRFDAGEGVVFAVTLAESGQLMGAIGLVINQEHRRAEMGYWMGKPYWNNGYTTEAAEALLHYAFSGLELNRITATHLTRNPASGRVMQKNGMKYEGRLRQHVVKWGEFEDLESYGILGGEYLGSVDK